MRHNLPPRHCGFRSALPRGCRPYGRHARRRSLCGRRPSTGWPRMGAAPLRAGHEWAPPLYGLATSGCCPCGLVAGVAL
ncbi:hypothetical protein BHM03_00017320 [Ensete ventricosum]|nr:hypothetical protein BHM03_00017320 [Ensete ventricosum]